jgi:serpin B
MKKLLVLVLAAVFALSGCGALSDNGGVAALAYRAELKEQPVGSLGEDFSRGVNDFGFGAAELLYDTDANLALSPVSIELALAMTRAGAAGETAEEMKNALALSALSDEQIIEACRQLMWRANTGGMEAANSIWLGKRYTYSKDFVNTCLNDFMADAYPLEIPGAMDDINAWVSEKTHERIDKLLEQEPDEATEMILCNALYYLGDWVLPFEANDTYDEDFNTLDGPVSAPFMHSEWSIPYYENDAFSMISLKFKSEEGEGKYAMALLLPAEGTDISGMLAALDGDSFAAALSGLTEQQVQIKLPKFEYMYTASLKDTLIGMGMQRAFDANTADFSGMTEEQNLLFISAVLHKCYIRVDELGAEAAAVTEVAVEDASAPAEPPATFDADRPFLFAIYSQEDGTVAFLGVVNDPTKS